MTNSERDLKYKFNDLQVCDISLLPIDKYRGELENIYYSPDHKNHYFEGKKKKQSWICMDGPSLNENPDNKDGFINVH